MPPEQTQAPSMWNKNTLTGIVIAVAIILLAWWYLASSPATAPTPKAKPLSSEVLQSLTATSTSTKPLSKAVLKSLTATSTSAKPLSPEVLQSLTAH